MAPATSHVLCGTGYTRFVSNVEANRMSVDAVLPQTLSCNPAPRGVARADEDGKTVAADLLGGLQANSFIGAGDQRNLALWHDTSLSERQDLGEQVGSRSE